MDRFDFLSLHFGAYLGIIEFAVEFTHAFLFLIEASRSRDIPPLTEWVFMDTSGHCPTRAVWPYYYYYMAISIHDRNRLNDDVVET
jgi:hypothetical protein